MNTERFKRLKVASRAAYGRGLLAVVSAQLMAEFTFAAYEPDLLFPISGSMRAALGAFAKLYSDRYAKDNLRMNNVLPGYIDSLPEKEERRA